MTRLLAVCLILGACSSLQQQLGPKPPMTLNTEPVERPPLALRRCLPPVRPPAVPPAPRSIEQLAQYAWAEASARWRTADRLEDCRRQMDRAIEYLAADDNTP
jgi:hypothetical protein